MPVIVQLHLWQTEDPDKLAFIHWAAQIWTEQFGFTNNIHWNIWNSTFVLLHQMFLFSIILNYKDSLDTISHNAVFL